MPPPPPNASLSLIECRPRFGRTGLRPLLFRHAPSLPRFALMALALALVACSAEAGVGRGPALTTDHSITVWGIADGLLPFSVRSITQTEDGYLWVGTFSGLCRFDGMRFTVFTASDTPGLLADNIRTMHQGSDGILWLGTEGGGLVQYQRGQFSPVPSTLPGNAYTVFAIHEDLEGTLWIGTDRGLLQLDAGKLISVEFEVAVTDSSVRALGTGPDGELWAGLARGVAMVERGRLTESRHVSPRPVVQLEWDEDGRLWTLYTSRRMGSVIADSSQLVYRTPEDFRITALCATLTGPIWFGVFEQGLFVAPSLGGIPRKVADTPGLVNALYEDRDGNLWAGVENSGLWRVRRSRVRLLDERHGLRSPSVISLAAAPDGTVWVGTFGKGLHVWTGDGFEPVDVSPDAGNVASVCRSSDGTLWCGVVGGGVFARRPGKDFTLVPGTERDSIRVILEDREGKIWIGTSGTGLMVIEREHLRRYTRGEGLSDDRVLCLAEGPDGAFWIGTEQGLNRMRDGRFETYFRENGLGSDTVRSMWMDPEGTLWLGTLNGGLTRHRNGRFDTITSHQGLRSSLIEQILDDGLGRLWLGSSEGILRLDLAELNGCLDGHAASVHCTVFGSEDGFPAILSGTGFQPSSVRLPSGELWFCTSLGVATIDSTASYPAAAAPQVYLESVTLDGQRARGGPPYPSAEWETAVQIPPGTSRLDFNYAGLSLVSPAKVRFRYRLEGYESDWVEAGTDRIAHYTRVPPGDYRFHVIAANNEGVWNETGATLAITVMPAWWQHPGFQAAAMAALIVLGTLVYRFRMRQVQSTERVRLRIARDLHDEVGSNLGSIALLSQAASRNDEPASARDFNEITRVARETAEAMRDIVWLISPDEDRLERLVLRMRETAGTLLAGTTWRFHAPDHLPVQRLSTEFKRHVLLIFKEALHNVRKHARASRVDVHLELRNGQLELRITDDGVGMDPDAQRTGQGLENLRRRAAELGSQLQLESRPSAGTTLRLSVPLK
jgi:ligand-binding sensor domain-containing protein/signal transduction histidine kinase